MRVILASLDSIIPFLGHFKCLHAAWKLWILAVKPKNTKLTYAEMVRVNATVEAQDHLIGNSGDPITASLVNADIKKE